MRKSEHERIVAELRAEVVNAEKKLANQQLREEQHRDACRPSVTPYHDDAPKPWQIAAEAVRMLVQWQAATLPITCGADIERWNELQTEIQGLDAERWNVDRAKLEAAATELLERLVHD